MCEFVDETWNACYAGATVTIRGEFPHEMQVCPEHTFEAARMMSFLYGTAVILSGEFA